MHHNHDALRDEQNGSHLADAIFKMADILHIPFSNHFLKRKLFCNEIKISLNLFLMDHWSINQHQFRWWFSQATSHYVNEWQPNLFNHFGHGELIQRLTLSHTTHPQTHISWQPSPVFLDTIIQYPHHSTYKCIWQKLGHHCVCWWLSTIRCWANRWHTADFKLDIFLESSLTITGHTEHICIIEMSFHLFKLFAACLAPRYYLNKCWFIINSTLRSEFQWNFMQTTNIFNQENAFQNSVCKMVAILLRPQCDNMATRYQCFSRTNIEIGNPTYIPPTHSFRYLDKMYQYLTFLWSDICTAALWKI